MKQGSYRDVPILNVLLFINIHRKGMQVNQGGRKGVAKEAMVPPIFRTTIAGAFSMSLLKRFTSNIIDFVLGLAQQLRALEEHLVSL